MTREGKELVETIGRQLRDLPELSATEPLPLDVELHLQILDYVERQARREAPNGPAVRPARTPAPHSAGND